jgi:hypothetical protein
MKRIVFSILLLSIYQVASAQNEIKPDGDKLLYLFGFIVLAVVSYFVFRKKGTSKKPLFVRRKVSIELKKDRMYFPDNLKMKVENIGNTDIDLDKPMLILDNFWLKRKFKLKGMENRIFYPLYLEKGKTHTLNIDLNRFYLHDKNLKKYPKAIIVLSDVKGKQLGKKSIYLRKTLFKF